MKNNLNKILTIPDFIRVSAQNFPDKTALTFEEETYSYKDFDQSSTKIAKTISSNNPEHSVVAILLPNGADFLKAYFAVLKAGCTALLLAPNIADNKLVFQIDKTKPKLIITEKKYLNKLKRTKVEKKLHIKTAQELEKSSSEKELPNVTPEHVSTVIFTSGTTSEPKGVKLKHKNVVQATKNIIEFLDFSDTDTDVNILALSHSFGLGNIHSIFAVGGSTILFKDAINIPKILHTISDSQATTFAAVPATLRMIMDNYKELFTDKTKSLRFVQTDTSLLEKKLIDDVLDSLPNGKFAYYYGLTEASRSTFIYFNDHLDKKDSIGQASPNVKLSIQETAESGFKKLPLGKVGEICIKGDSVINEYWDNPEASNAIQDGWLHTGDFGYIDDDRFLYYISRRDDIINVSGEKLAPDDIEEVLRKFSYIVDVAIIGVPDKLLGQVVKAYIVGHDKEISEEQVKKDCNRHLESFKVPAHIEFIDSIPRTDNGKVQRSKLRELHANKTL